MFLCPSHWPPLAYCSNDQQFLSAWKLSNGINLYLLTDQFKIDQQLPYHHVSRHEGLSSLYEYGWRWIKCFTYNSLLGICSLLSGTTVTQVVIAVDACPRCLPIQHAEEIQYAEEALYKTNDSRGCLRGHYAENHATLYPNRRVSMNPTQWRLVIWLVEPLDFENSALQVHWVGL